MHRVHEYEEMHNPKPPPVVEGFWGPAEWMFSVFHEVQTIIGQVTASMGIVTTLTIYSIVLMSIGHLAEGIFNHFVCGGKFFAYGFANGFQSAGIIMSCFVERIFDVMSGDCLRFYVVDMVFGLIYFIGSAVLSIIYSLTGVDLMPFVSIIWNVTVVPLDSLIYALTGHNITKWSRATIDRCYKCKPRTFNINGDITKSAEYNLGIMDWFRVFHCSVDEMKEGMYKMVTSVVPSSKWVAWAKEEHLDGSDDNPGFTF